MSSSADSFDYRELRELDEVIHVMSRLQIVAALSGVEEAEFTHLRRVVGLTDGTLSVHLRKLEDLGYVAVQKDYVGRRPRTRCRLTPKGRSAFQAYLARMADFLAAMRKARTPNASRAHIDRKLDIREKRSTWLPSPAAS